MPPRPAPLLHREDPDKDPLAGHIKVTRDDWLNVARDLLVGEGIAGVKILVLAERLQVSRSSFYWYFRNRAALCGALLDDWERRNTGAILTQCGQPSGSISEAVCDFFRCFIDPGLFDCGLDFAVRDWARADTSVRARVDTVDAARLEAVTRMFTRHGYPADEADIRARILYYMQLGYHALDVTETMATRMVRIEGYLNGFTGRAHDPVAVAAFREFALAIDGGD